MSKSVVFYLSNVVTINCYEPYRLTKTIYIQKMWNLDFTFSLYQNTFSIFFFKLFEKSILYLLIKLYFMFIGSLARVFSPIVHSAQQLYSVQSNGENWTKQLFVDFRKWSVSQLLDHLRTSNKVYLGASTFLSTNMKNKQTKTHTPIMDLCWKRFKKINMIFWMYKIFCSLYIAHFVM